MKTLLSALIGAALAASCLAAGAEESSKEEFTKERLVELDIESRTLTDALNEWAQETGFNLVSHATNITDRVTAPRVKGALTAKDALVRLLDGTSLTYRQVNERTIAISKRGDSTSDGLGTLNLEQPRIRVAYLTDDAKKVEPMAQANTARSDRLTSADVDRRSNDWRGRASQVEEIVVTGTHIHGIENETTSVIVIDREMIERTGYSTTQDLFRSLPQNFSGGQAGASDDGRFGTGAKVGLNFTSANGINLRGLGDSSTLVLLNGHRIAPSAYGAVVDVSLIPLAAIERIEMLPDGSSALYGSDAVGGVVNIITRSDFRGASTSARYAAAIDSSRSERLLAQSAGGTWDGGNLVAAAQYQEQGELRAEDRDFASGLTRPNDLLPDAESYGVALNARHRFSDAVQLYGDSLFSRRNIRRDTSFPDFGGLVGDSRADSQGFSVAAGLEYLARPNWRVDIGAQFSEQISQQRSLLASSTFEQRESNDVTFEERAVDAVLNGALIKTKGGDVRLAFGATYREENLDQHTILASGDPLDEETKRDVSAAFAELYVPIVGDANALPLLRSLALSGAFRHDDYSDFGSTSTPRIGLHWAPSSQVSTRVAYSESFRAPNPGELLLTDEAFLLVFPVADPSGMEVVPAFVQVGSRRSIDPERARILSAGFEFRPDFIPGFKLSADYYRIRYIDRIVTPSFDASALTRPDVYGSLIAPIASDSEAQALIDAATASGQQFVDVVGTGAAGVRHVIDFRQQNAASVRQSGFDVTASYSRGFASGTFIASATAATIQAIDTAFAPGARATDLVSTLGNPVDLRARADAAWDSRGGLINIAANYVDDYVNTSVVGNPRITSWTTFDVVGRLNLDAYLESELFKGMTITFSVHNLFDKAPPFVDAPSLIAVNYDPANASPLRRVLAVELAKLW